MHTGQNSIVPESSLPQIEQTRRDSVFMGLTAPVVRLDPAFKDEWDQAQRDGTTVAAAGAWISDGKYFGRPEVSARTKAILTLGGFQYAMNYRQALKRQMAWQAALGQVFKKVDFIALSTLQQLPPKISRFWGSALLKHKS
jgi:Asp-tRNA(Asn)/Glu-tRNA(Gln) amidotransferase A subunit family amidase